MDKEEKNPGKSPAQVADILGIGQVEAHLFLCTGPDCCTPEQGDESWQALKKAIKDKYPVLPEAKIYRTKVGCLRICKQGPIAVVYPYGKWFQGVTPDKVGELVEHIDTGARGPHPLEFKAHPLPHEP